SYTSDELIAATGIDESMIVGKDRFEFRLLLTLTNGEEYSNDDVGGPVSGGAYFSSPFEYFPEVLCSITEDLSGTHSYVTTVETVAPGQTPPDDENGDPVAVACDLSEGADPVVVMGEVTWTTVDGTPGEYTSTDLGFGQFSSCFPGRGPATGNDITIVWDCTNLTPDGEVYIKDSVVIPDDDDEDRAFSYGYTITSVVGAEMTIEFSNALGDSGTVVLTREGDEAWPPIFLSNNDD
ncbi:MAG: hypothetical protein AAGH46_13715, partial [Bacteroidota bacterium]